VQGREAALLREAVCALIVWSRELIAHMLGNAEDRER
jgi:hypothetical protein